MPPEPGCDIEGFCSNPRPVCAADGTCFRVVQEHIERKVDGGGWERAWSIPLDRQSFVGAHAGGLFGCPESGDDMRFTTNLAVVDSLSGAVGIIAMGDQGVVVISGDGALRVGVGSTEPTPFTAGFSGYALEALLLVSLTLLLFWLMSAVALLVSTRGRPSDVGQIPLLLGLPAPPLVFGLSFTEPIVGSTLIALFPISLIALWSGVRRAIGVAAPLVRLVLLGCAGFLAVPSSHSNCGHADLSMTMGPPWPLRLSSASWQPWYLATW
jgi:hypothetical protein